MTKRWVRRAPVVQPQDQSIRYIPLTHGQVAIVDAADHEWLSQWNWHAFWNKCTHSFYARRGHGGPFMHNMVLGSLGGDHRNHDTLDHRRSNLRPSTHSQNMMNRRRFKNNKSGVTGVSWRKRDQKWAVYICVNKKLISLGYFPEAEIDKAITARKKAEAKYHAEFACVEHYPRSG